MLAARPAATELGAVVGIVCARWTPFGSGCRCWSWSSCSPGSSSRSPSSS